MLSNYVPVGRVISTNDGVVHLLLVALGSLGHVVKILLARSSIAIQASVEHIRLEASTVNCRV